MKCICPKWKSRAFVLNPLCSFHNPNAVADKATKEPQSSTQSILEEAQQIISGPRRESYGPVEQSFQEIADIWTAVSGAQISPSQVALMMIGLKLQRESNKHQRDNLVDIVGYTLLLEQLEEKENT